MRMIPARITAVGISPAEIWLFRQLSELDLPDTWACLHSVNLPEHIYKQMGELDFVIAGPRAILVLEVKGGGVACHDGIWHFTDRWGIVHRRSEGPFQQARSGMFTLRNLLQTQLPETPVAQLPFGFGVVFPDCDFTVSGVEWHQRMVFDARMRQDAGAMGRYIAQLTAWWNGKQSEKNLPGISPDHLSAIVRALRPNFELLPALRLQAESVENRLVSLTRQQYELLDMIESNPRLLIDGGAGTGKTLVAIEAARRHAVAGDRVLVVCVSPVLASFMNRQIASDRVDVFDLESLVLRISGTCRPDIARRLHEAPVEIQLRIPVLLDLLSSVSAAVAPTDRWDVLIVDEGQDLICLDFLAPVSDLLAGGIEQGRWRIFHDHFNQGAVFGIFDPEAAEYLHGHASAIRLIRNCRNTDEIVIQTRLLTGADLGTESTGPGPVVRYDWYRNREHCAVLLEKSLGALRREGIEDRFITILSPLPFDRSAASLLPKETLDRLALVSEQGVQPGEVDRLTFATVSDFKGLENRFIELIDIEDAGTNPVDRSLLYVGMSRARASLRIFINRNLKDSVSTVMMDHLSVVQRGLTGSNVH